MGCRPIPQHKWGYGVAQKDLRRLQPRRDVVQQLLCGGLIGVDLLQTFVSPRIQPLRQRGMTIWMCPGPSYPDRPFSGELGDMEINSQIREVLAHGANLNFGSSLVPLREGIKSPWVSLLELILVYLCQFLLLKRRAFFLCAGSQVCIQCPMGSHLT
jgi:hypothetical protein